MRKVYIVTAGIYSDYHIEQVFSTKEQAQIYLDHIGNADSANIEEYNVDVETPRGVFGYRVTIQDDSSNTEVCLCDFDKSPFWCKDAFQWTDETLFMQERGTIWFNVEAKDAPHAIKIASERLMQIRAMPYLFPLLKNNCVFSKNKYKRRATPIYNYKTREILLNEDEWVE